MLPHKILLSEHRKICKNFCKNKLSGRATFESQKKVKKIYKKPSILIKIARQIGTFGL